MTSPHRALLERLRDAEHQADAEAEKLWNERDRNGLLYYRTIGRVDGLRHAIELIEWDETMRTVGP